MARSGARPANPSPRRGSSAPSTSAPSRSSSGRSSKARPSRWRRFRRRYLAPPDLHGPKVRLGVGWFLLAGAAIALGPLPTAAVYGGVAAAAAAQVARCWQRVRSPSPRPNEVVAAVVAGGMGLGAWLGAGGSAIVLLAGVIAAIGAATTDPRSPNRAVADAGFTLQCALFPGLAAMSVVLLARLDQGSAIALLLLVSAYEIGDFVVGSGARNPFEGPVAGWAALAVVTFIVATLPVSTLDFGQVWLFGAVVAVGVPAGQVLAAALLPSAQAPAAALRRLDSLLIVAPVWAWGVGLLA